MLNYSESKRPWKKKLSETIVGKAENAAAFSPFPTLYTLL